jgi:Probable lipoprotein LpqN
VRPLPTAVAIAALTASVAGCAPKSPDFQSVLTTSSTTSAAATTTGKAVAISKYLESVGVVGVPVAPDALTDLTVSIPTPPGWSPYTNPKIPPTTQVISKGEKYPTAMLIVFKLNGSGFDVAEAVKHANADAEQLPGFAKLDASSADYDGFPSSMIQGSYDLDGTRLHSFNRIVFPTGSPPANQRYLVQLSITALAKNAVEQSSDIEAIIRGLVVKAK